MTSHYSDSTLEIHLAAIVNNYKHFANKVENAACAAVVKADAYGLGVNEVAPILEQGGCSQFFVATLDEGIELRKTISKPSIRIYVLHGPIQKYTDEFLHHQLTPVINSTEQLNIWHNAARTANQKLPAIIHIDTAMNRLGIEHSNVASCMALLQADNQIEPLYLMSHLACAEQQDHELNKIQQQRFMAITGAFPYPKTLANSSGVFLGSDYHFSMVRVGAGLYGVNPLINNKNPLRPVIKLKSRIIQLRTIDSYTTVGYGATCNLPIGGKLAVVPVGYADGYLRSAGNKAYAWLADKKIPLVGQVSMDLSIFDVSSVPEQYLNPGQYIELLNEHITVDDLAGASGTIGYEILTGLGRRYSRQYLT